MEINGLIIESVVVGSVGTNCYIVHKKDSEHCFVVDPGDSGDKIANYICDQKMILDHILLTHGHFDHIQGVRDLKNAIRCEICALDVEKELLSDARMNVSAMTGRPESDPHTGTYKRKLLLFSGRAESAFQWRYAVYGIRRKSGSADRK